MKTPLSEQLRSDIKDLFDQFECNVDAMSMVEEWVASTVLTYYKHIASGDHTRILDFLGSQMDDFAENIMGWHLASVRGDNVPEGLVEELEE